MSEFETSLQEQFGYHNPIYIDELILDDFWDAKESLNEEEKLGLEKYKNLIHLSLNNLKIKTLKNFPSIKILYFLSINGNELNGDDLDLIPKLYPKLSKLKIGNNKIENIECFSKLKCLNLRKIEVKGNPFVEKEEKYIDKLFEMIPSLKIIDNKNKEGNTEETTDYHKNEEESEDEDFGEDKEKSEENDDYEDDNDDEYEGGEDSDEENDSKEKK